MFLSVVALLFALMAIIFVFSGDDQDVDASTIVDSGSCGTNMTWTLDDGGLLTITGSGDMSSYYDGGPWDKTLVESVVIEDGVTSIGQCAFNGCSSLSSVTLPDSLTVIWNQAFQDCTSLASITLPNSLTAINYRAFYHCTSLTEIDIPDSVEDLYSEVFGNCSSLTTLNIGSGLVSYTTFFQGTQLSRINIDVNNEKYSSIDGVMYNKTGTKLILYPINKPGPSFIIPESVDVIGQYAFNNCTNLTSIVLPSSPITIEGGAFQNCTSLSSLLNTDNITSLEGVVFDGCASLSSIDLPNATTIGSSCFSRCTNLKTVYAPNVTSLGSRAFLGCESLESIQLGYFTSLDEATISGCKSLKILNIPASVTIIDSSNFYGCSSLQSIDVDRNNEHFTSIDGVLFNKDGSTLIHCPASITNYTVPASVSILSKYSFSDSKIQDLIIEGDYISVERSFMYNCDSLKRLVMPNITSVFLIDDHTGTVGMYISGNQYKDFTFYIFTSGYKFPDCTVMYGNYEYMDSRYYSPEGATLELKQNDYVDSSALRYYQYEAESNPDFTMTANFSDDIKMTFDSVAIKNIVQTGSLMINVDKSGKYKTIVGDRPVYEILCSFSYTNYKDFGDGKVTIIIPYTMEEGKNAEDLRIHYIANNKIAETLQCTYDGSAVTFTTNHFSAYSIGYDEPSSSPGNGPNFWVIIVVIPIAAVGVFITYRKFFR